MFISSSHATYNSHKPYPQRVASRPRSGLEARRLPPATNFLEAPPVGSTRLSTLRTQGEEEEEKGSPAQTRISRLLISLQPPLTVGGKQRAFFFGLTALLNLLVNLSFSF